MPAKFTSSNIRTAPCSSINCYGGIVSVGETAGANGTGKNFQGGFAIPNGTSTETLNAFILTSCLIATCDFSHTGTLSLGSLPSGVSFTSSSGVLLSDDSAVPEPPTWGLLLCAAAPLAVNRRNLQ